MCEEEEEEEKNIFKINEDASYRNLRLKYNWNGAIAFDLRVFVRCVSTHV